MKITLTEISKIHLKKLHTLLCQGQSWGKESVHIHGKHLKAQKRREKSKKKFLEICHIFLHYLYSKIDQISTKLQKFGSPLWGGLWSCSYLLKSLNESLNADYHFFPQISLIYTKEAQIRWYHSVENFLERQRKKVCERLL